MITTIATGTLGRDATTKTLEGGRNVISFSMAVNTGYKDKQVTYWYDCSYFTDKTGIVPYLTKGAKVLVTGEPGSREYDKKDGTKGFALTLRVANIELIGGKQEGGQAPQQSVSVTGQREALVPPANAITEDGQDLPF